MTEQQTDVADAVLIPRGGETKMNDRERLSLEVAPAVKDQLNALVERSGATSITEVVRRALSLYDLVLEHEAEGGSLIFRHKDGEEEKLRLLL